MNIDQLVQHLETGAHADAACRITVADMPRDADGELETSTDALLFAAYGVKNSPQRGGSDSFPEVATMLEKLGAKLHRPYMFRSKKLVKPPLGALGTATPETAGLVILEAALLLRTAIIRREMGDHQQANFVIAAAVPHLLRQAWWALDGRDSRCMAEVAHAQGAYGDWTAYRADLTRYDKELTEWVSF